MMIMMMMNFVVMILMVTMTAALSLDRQEEPQHTSNSQTMVPDFLKRILQMDNNIVGILIPVFCYVCHLYAIVDGVVCYIVSVKKKIEDFIEAWEFIASVWKKCVTGFTYCWKKIQCMFDRLIRREVFLPVPDQTHVAEDNTENSALLLCETSITIEDTSQNSESEEPPCQRMLLKECKVLRS